MTTRGTPGGILLFVLTSRSEDPKVGGYEMAGSECRAYDLFVKSYMCCLLGKMMRGDDGEICVFIQGLSKK